MTEAGAGRTPPDDVVVALRQGRKIEAIRLLREARGLELKEARDEVERIIAADPGLRRKHRTTTVSGARSLLFWFMVLLFVGFAAWQLFTGH